MSAAVSLDEKRHLTVLSNSELRTWRLCARRHDYQYRKLRRERRKSTALAFGTLWHLGMEHWWQSTTDRLGAGLAAMQASPEVDPFMLAVCEVLLVAYTALYGDQTLRTICVEQRFEVPLINPETGAASRTYVIGGKFDGIAEDDAARQLVVEHKSTGSDIEEGSLYWKKVQSLDTQVSLYLAGAKAAGYDVEACLYDVVRKPGIKPLKATPEADRKYILPKSRACKGCKKDPNGTHHDTIDGVEVACVEGRIVTDPGGRLYADQRETDETPAEFATRLAADIDERPERYFARGEIVRLEADERDHAYDTWQQARMMREAELAGYAPKNPDSCSAFGGCPYLPCCSGETTIDDDSLYRTADTAHEELITETES